MGHIIKLGTTSALRNYTLKPQGDGIAWQRGPANPFAAKINASGQFDKIDIWNEWVQEDWPLGVGRVDPMMGGFLYGELDSRVPKQLILSQGMEAYTPIRSLVATQYTSFALMPGQFSSSTTRATRTLTTGSGSPYLGWKLLGEITGTGSYDVAAVWVYGECANGTVLRADIYSETSSSPGTSAGNASITVTNDFPGPQWHKIAVSVTARDVETSYWAVIRPTTGTFIVHGTGNVANPNVQDSAAGSVWASVTTFQPFYLIEVVTNEFSSATDNPPNQIARIVPCDHAGGVLFIGNAEPAALGVLRIGAWTRTAGIPYLQMQGSNSTDSATDAAIFNNLIFIATNDEVHSTPLTGTGIFSDATVAFPNFPSQCKNLLSFGGYLWVTKLNADSLATTVQYSGDLSTWTNIGQVCSSPYEIRSLAGMERDVYCACDDGLYRIAPGDVVEGIVPWQPDSTNGRSMCNYGGALYIVVNGRILRYAQDGSIQDVWVSRDDDLPANRLGEVVYVCATDLWLVALVLSTSGRSSVWAKQDDGWHHITTLPTNTASTMTYDRDSNKLWIGTSNGYAFAVYMPVNALNPFNDTTSIYMPAGWIQQDRYYGGQYLLDKDFESVTIVGDNLSANVNVKVYFQDEGSTDWESLGTADTDGEELRWSNHAIRPQGKWCKLGVLLTTNDADETPRVRAIIVKNLPMVNDRIRDTVTLTLKSNVEMPDGTPDSFTLAQQLTHIKSMIGSVIPIIYEDPLAVQYEVKVVDWNMGVTRFDHIASSNVVGEMDVTLVLEQTPDTVYVAA
jgi:hypothetical protein